MNPYREAMIKEMQIRNFAKETQLAYLKAIRQLSDYHGKSPEKLTEDNAQEFILHLAYEKKQSRSSCNVAASGIRFFYSAVMKIRSTNFYVPLSKKEQKLPDILTKHEVIKLLSFVKHPMHKTALTVMYSSGLRVSEVVKLRIKDIDSKTMVICVRAGKGNKDRYTPLSKNLLLQLRAYWQEFRPKDYLFPGRSANKTVASRTLRESYNNAKNRAGIKKESVMHGLRHSFATHLLEYGTNIIDIKQCLGHSSLSSTLRYARMSRKLIGEITSPFDL